MTKLFNLSEIEKKAYRSTFQDGLWDIVWGVIIIGMGINTVLKNMGVPKPLYYLVIPLIAVLIGYFGKQRITIPRMGFVRFGPKREQTKRKIWILASIITPIQIILIILIKMQIFQSTFETGLSNYVGPLFLVMFTIIIFAIIAHIIDFPRFFLFGILMGLSIITAEILYLHVGSPLDGLIPFSIAGTIILVNGLVLMVRSLKKYPRTNEEVGHG